MKKLSEHLPVQLQVTKVSQNVSCVIDMPKHSQATNPTSPDLVINSELLSGESGAATLLDQFALLWQNQWLKGKSIDDIPELLEAWIHELSHLTPAAAERACLVWKNSPYPPDLAAFLAASHRKDIEELYRFAADTANQVVPDYSTLPALAYAAGRKFGWPLLREARWDSRNTQERWAQIILELEKFDDLALLPPPPPKPAGLLNRPKSVMPDDIAAFLRNFRTRNSSANAKQ